MFKQKLKTKEGKGPVRSFEDDLRLYIKTKLGIYKYINFIKIRLPGISIILFSVMIFFYMFIVNTTLFLYASLSMNLFIILVLFFCETVIYTIFFFAKDELIDMIFEYESKINITSDDIEKIIKNINSNTEIVKDKVLTFYHIRILSNLIYEKVAEDIVFDKLESLEQ